MCCVNEDSSGIAYFATPQLASQASKKIVTWSNGRKALFREAFLKVYTARMPSAEPDLRFDPRDPSRDLPIPPPPPMPRPSSSYAESPSGPSSSYAESPAGFHLRDEADNTNKATYIVSIVKSVTCDIWYKTSLVHLKNHHNNFWFGLYFHFIILKSYEKCLFCIRQVQIASGVEI